MNKLTLRFIFKLVVGALLLTIIACASSSSRPFMFSNQHDVGDTFMGIRLRGTVELPPVDLNGIRVAELSALAWDADENLLYALSDRCQLFHLRPLVKEETLQSVDFLKVYRLTDNQGKPLPGCDSEGMDIVNGRNGIRGDAELVISFERKPRIARFNTVGKQLEEYTLPAPLNDAKNYLSNNRMLESVAVHPQLGILTAPELPLKAPPAPANLWALIWTGKHTHILYSLNGQQWRFPAYPAPNSAVVAIEPFDNHSVLVLERAFTSIMKPFIISIRRVTLSTCNCAINQDSSVEELAVFDNSQGWYLDNFEGMTRYQDKFFFIVSDDNGRSLQRTLLSLFEVVK